MREDMQLVGVVDHHRKGFALYRSMGFATRFYTDLELAVREQQPQGVIIATPASTHLDLARWCMERSLPVLVEKPLTIRAEDVPEFRRLAADFPNVPCVAGYMAAQYPHFGRAQQLIRDRVLGNVVGFRLVALQSHIMAPKPVRW
jgi:predicted dehydrogenase